MSAEDSSFRTTLFKRILIEKFWKQVILAAGNENMEFCCDEVKTRGAWESHALSRPYIKRFYTHMFGKMMKCESSGLLYIDGRGAKSFVGYFEVCSIETATSLRSTACIAYPAVLVVEFVYESSAVVYWASSDVGWTSACDTRSTWVKWNVMVVCKEISCILYNRDRSRRV